MITGRSTTRAGARKEASEGFPWAFTQNDSIKSPHRTGTVSADKASKTYLPIHAQSKRTALGVEPQLGIPFPSHVRVASREPRSIAESALADVSGNWTRTLPPGSLDPKLSMMLEQSKCTSGFRG